MSVLVAFAVGYVVGARSGSAGFDRVEDAVRELRESEEFQHVVDALRAHVKETVQVAGRRLQGG